MKKKPFRWKPKRVLRLPDLDHAKTAVLNTLGSPDSERSYRFAIDDFIAWYLRSTRRSSSATGCNSKLATCRHPRSTFAWPRSVASPTKRLIVVCSVLSLPLASVESKAPRNSGCGLEIGSLQIRERRFSAFQFAARFGASETLRCWHCSSVSA